MHENISKWLNEEERDSLIKGNLKRLAKLLRAFSSHPDGEQAQNLAKSISKVDPYSAQIKDVFSEILDWVKVASQFERKETEVEKYER